MLFKSGLFGSLVTSLSVLVLGAALSSCSLPTNENPPKQKELEFKPGEKAQCLSTALPTLKRFVDGDANAEEVESTWDCFGTALDLFGTYVRGDVDGAYSSRELANFFEVYFLKDVKISDRLLAEMMRIKQIFVGGGNSTLTRDELEKLKVVVRQVRGISLQLRPYMKVFSFHWKVSSYRTLENDVHYFEDANAAIQESAKALAALIAKNGNAYVIADFAVLLEEFSGLYHETWGFVTELKKVMPFVHKLKRTLAGGEETSIAPHEWRRFALLGARGYIQFLRYHYFISTNDEVGGGPELVYLARSFDDLFSYLGDMVAEKPTGLFTRTELLEVFQALGQFFPDFKMSDPFLLEVMRIKRLVFGGSLETFTPQDFQKARTKVDIFRSIIERTLTNSDLYGLTWQPGQLSFADATRFFKAGETGLLEAAKALGLLIEEGYDLRDALKFAKEFEALYPPESTDISLVSTLKRYLPLIVSARQVLFSDESFEIKKDQWTLFLTVSAQLYNRYMHFYYFLRPTEISLYSGNGLSSFSTFINDLIVVVNSIIEAKPNAIISFSDLNKITQAASDAEVLPKALPLKTLNDLLRVVLQKMLVDPKARLSGKIPQGLSTEATVVLREEFKLWFSNQKFFDRLYQNYQPGEAIDGAKILQALKVETPELGLWELQSIFLSPQSRAFDGLGRLTIWQEASPYTLFAANTVNLSRMITRVLMRSYSQELSRIEKYEGINVVEANSIYADFKPLFVALGMVDEENVTFADSRFRESNLFTPRANGNSLASYTEFADLVLNIFSGLKLDLFVREKMIQGPNACPVVHDRVSNKDKISIHCFVDTYAREMNSIFASMPGMKAYMLSLPRCDLFTGKVCARSLDFMLLNMLKAAGYLPEKQGLVSLDITSLVPHVMQYIETILQRFDQVHVRNSDGKVVARDGIIDADEAMVAYPVLKETLSVVSCYYDDKTLQGLLAWIMENGRPPESIKEKLSFISYVNFPEKWNIKVDRARLADILGFISEAIANSKSSKACKPPKALRQAGPRSFGP